MIRLRWALLGLPLIAAPAPAQAPAARLSLVTFRDSLQSIDSTARLLQQREILRGEVRNGVGDLSLVRLGLVWLRLAAVTGDGDGFGAAASAFEEVTERRPDWPLAWDGLAEASYGELRSQKGAITHILEMFGADPNARVARRFVRGAEVDPGHRDGLRRLALQAEPSEDQTLREIALTALRFASALPASADPQIRLARARLERDAGFLDSASVQLEALVEAEPANAEALLELARIRFIMGHIDGLGPWYRGLAAADSAVYLAYRRDLAWVIPDSLLSHLDGIAAAERPAAARREWQRQDPDGLPVIGDRLRDHYRRLEFARQYYRRRLDGQRADPLDWSGPLDARGEIYVRHGPPAHRASLGRHGGPFVDASLGIVGAPPNETWRYGPPDERALIFHFMVRERGGDFTRAESALDILAQTNQHRMFRAADVPEGVDPDSLPPPIQTYGAELVSVIARELFASRLGTHPVYRQLLDAGKDGAEVLQQSERLIGRTSMAATPTWALRYELPLTAEVTVLAVDREAGAPLLQVAFAIAGSSLLPIRTARGVGYRVRMRAAVLDADGAVIASVDTTRGFLTPTVLRPQDHLLGRLPIAVPPGRHSVRVALEADGLGLVTPRQFVDVPPPDGSQLALSDLVLGTRSVALPWVTSRRDTAWINPLRSFPRDSPLELYFEATGIPAGAEYRVEVAFIRVSGRDAISREAERVVERGGRADLTIGFDQRHSSGVAGIAREISLNRLQPGEYVIELTLITTDGARVMRRQPLLVTR
ncbi:MAG: hypothetical protein U0974_06580 [Gemmatimonadales bacterium]|nr:hypothetical protein [Gemmatimonadales bacterium]MDZ4389378.1 hypothetical protein [Gemmatimonadales bacterium]